MKSLPRRSNSAVCELGNISAANGHNAGTVIIQLLFWAIIKPFKIRNGKLISKQQN